MSSGQSIYGDNQWKKARYWLANIILYSDVLELSMAYGFRLIKEITRKKNHKFGQEWINQPVSFRYPFEYTDISG